MCQTLGQFAYGCSCIWNLALAYSFSPSFIRNRYRDEILVDIQPDKSNLSLHGDSSSFQGTAMMSRKALNKS